MNVSCPDCGSTFRVDPAKVPEVGVQARCSVCGGIISVSRVNAEAPHPDVAAVGSAMDSGSPRAVGEQSDAPSAFAAPPDMRSEDTVVPAQNADEPSAAPASGDMAATPERAAPDASVNAAPAPAHAVGPSAPSDGRARPVNPYLNNTPELRARRLARALVSDLVAYNPQKREQGLRDGTLRQLFREEIRKSWDEYVEQVGATVAESTPHFQDALNDVLAGGRRVF